MDKKEVRQVAHDFNNILTTIKNSIDLLKQKLADNPDTLYLLDNINYSTNRATDLIDSLLNKDSTEKKRKISLVYLINELVNGLEHTFPSSISISKKVEEHLNKVWCVPNDIYRVILNLSVNAKEALLNSGQIAIECKNLDITDDIADKYFPLTNGSYIEISVSDTGGGIPEEHLKKIFNDGFSTKDKKIDSGIGLNIVKNIIDDHNGIIIVKSKIGEGTEFKIVLPAAKKTSRVNDPNKPGTILIGEDEEPLRDVMIDLFESYNYKVIGASNGIEVLEILKNTENVDLLVIDRKMPKMDGITCIKNIREFDTNIPIVLASGSPTSKDRFNINELYIDKILNKPYDFDELLELVNDLI
ncbi:MAG: response regulator [Melioribacteraceae bacterium]|nr:response regulator [Melioribacteraceae bacterium]